MDYNLPVNSPNQSVYEMHEGRHLALAKQIALQTRKKNDLGALFSNARMGYTPDDQERMEKEGRLKELTAQFVESTKDLDETQYQQAAEEFAAAQGAPMPQRQQAGLNAPNLAQGGFALLAMALDPQNAAQTGAAALNYQREDQQVRQGQNDQQYQADIAKRGEDIKAKQFGVARAQDDLERKSRSQDKLQTNLRMQLSDVQKSLDDMKDDERTEINQAFQSYQTARKSGVKITAARRLVDTLNKYGKGQLAPTPEEIMAEVEALDAENDRFASTEWENALKAELNAFGEVQDGPRAAQMEKQRMAIAARYGIDPANLRAIPTTQTIAAEKFALAQDQFKFLTSKTAEDFKLKWAAMQVSRQRAQTYQQAVANGYALGNVRNQISMGNLSMRQYEAQVKAVGQSAKSQLQSFLDKLKAESDPEKAKKIRADMNLFIGNIAQEFGLDAGEIAKDPIGSISKLMDAMNEQEQELQYDPATQEIPGEIPGSYKPLQVGPIGGAKKPKPKAKSATKAKPKTLTLPPGASLRTK